MINQTAILSILKLSIALTMPMGYITQSFVYCAAPPIDTFLIVWQIVL